MTDPATLARAIQLYQKARTHWSTGEQNAALASFEAARRLLPEHLPLLAEYAQRASEACQWENAARLYRRIGKLKPDSGFEGPLGFALVRQEQFVEAIPLLRAQLARTPDALSAWQALAVALAKTLAWEEALACATEITRLDPANPALAIELNAHFYTGNAAALDLLVEPVLEQFRDHSAVLSITGLHLLKRGEFARGFAVQHQCQWGGEHARADDADIAALPPWDGKPGDRLLLITGEQGLGEEILAARFFRALAASGQRCVITCEPRLLPVFRRSFPALEFVAHGSPERRVLVADRTPRQRLRALDLGHFFLREALADNAAWLLPDAARVAQIRDGYRARWPGRRTIGISWASHRKLQGRHGKSMPAAALAPLLAREDIVTVDCQYSDLRAGRDEFAAGLPAPWQDPDIDSTRDLDGLLAQLAALDGYIGVSNSTIHLAGAAGLPARLLLPQREPVFWYWGYEGARTPWYPSLQLFRNESESGWQDNLQHALAGL